MVLNTLWLIANTLRLKPWIVDDNDADRIVIGADLISSAYVRRYLQRISMETRKTRWCCQGEADARRMPSAERTSAAAANARAAETKEKAGGCSLQRSRGYFIHNPLMCGDTLSCCVLIKYVFQRQKKKPQILNDDDT